MSVWKWIEIQEVLWEIIKRQPGRQTKEKKSYGDCGNIRTDSVYNSKWTDLHGFTLSDKWLVKLNKLKIVRLFLSPLVALLIVVYFLSVPTSSNDETATIEKVGSNYQITLTGQRAYMAHDPISALSRDTYTEILKIIVSRAQGIINGQEIPTEKGYYKLLGTISIDEARITIDLYYANNDDKIKDSLSWNGEYRLAWKNK